MKLIQGLVISGLIVAIVCGGVPQTAFGLTTNELQAQLDALLAQVRTLQTQLAAQQTSGESTIESDASDTDASSTFCHQFNTNLRVGDAGSEVAALHTALAQEGIVVAASERNVSYFGDFTAQGVQTFQVKYRANILVPAGLAAGNGFVGALTRAKLNALYGSCNTSSDENPTDEDAPAEESEDPEIITTSRRSLTILTPNGGESYAKNANIPYSWSQNYEPVRLRVRLINHDSGTEYYIARISGRNSRNTGTLSGEAVNVPAGKYRVTICDEGVRDPQNRSQRLCDTSNRPFTIRAATTQGPTISHVQAPAEDDNILHVGESARIFGSGLSGVISVLVNSRSVLTVRDNRFDDQVSFTVPELASGNADLSVKNTAGEESNKLRVRIIGTTPETTPFAFTYPTAHAALKTGTAYTATWRGEHEGVNSYQAYLAGGPSNISIFLGHAAASSHSFRFTVPSGVSAGAGYKLSFRSPVMTSAESAAFSIIRPSGTVTPIDRIDSAEAFVENLYRTFYGRDSDASGLVFWTNSFNNGQPTQELYRAFLRASEFGERRGNISNRDYVALLYRAVLFRDPDTSGLDFWTADFDRSGKNKEDMLNAFLVSSEFTDSILPKLNDLREEGSCNDRFSACAQPEAMRPTPSASQLASVLDSARSILEALQGIWR